MREISRTGQRSGRRRGLVVTAVAAAAGVGLGSVAWACVPNADDTRTVVQTCTAPAGSSKVCKPMLNTPAFPNATAVKGPSGSRLTAYVPGPGMQPGVPYDLLFVSKTQLENGAACASDAATVISSGAGTIGTTDEAIGATQGQIPANSPLGAGQLCFASKLRSYSSSTPAVFKVNL